MILSLLYFFLIFMESFYVHVNHNLDFSFRMLLWDCTYLIPLTFHHRAVSSSEPLIIFVVFLVLAKNIRLRSCKSCSPAYLNRIWKSEVITSFLSFKILLSYIEQYCGVELKALSLQHLKCSNSKALKNGIYSMLIIQYRPLSVYKTDTVISNSEHDMVHRYSREREIASCGFA